MLYLIQSINYYKIGFTTNIKERMKSYKTTNPHAVLLGVAEGTEEDELQYHLKFKEYNHYTEWFELPDDIVQELLSTFTMDKCCTKQKKQTKPKPETSPITSVYNIKSVIARNILIWLNQHVGADGCTHITAGTRKQLCQAFHINSQQMSKALRLLKDSGFIEGELGVFKINQSAVNNFSLLI